ncbi:MAG: phosphate signaling complex protein PhoU [Rhodospirillales bacterium]|nr:phosphate signaling complex protein PhoU [Rhodospirillales bacterium]
MTQDHIVKSFDAELEQLDRRIAEMGGLAESQLAQAVEALVKRDQTLADRVVAADRRLDAAEDQIDAFAVQLLARRQPMAKDLRAVIVALKTASILERIGDYAKNIAKRTTALAQSPPIGSAAAVARMARLVQEMIKTVLDSYLARDPAGARQVRQRDVEVDALHTSLFRELLTYMMEDPRNITPCTHLLFVAKNIERIGDHATSIAEKVIYLVEGHPPAEERPKGDASSTTVVAPGDR